MVEDSLECEGERFGWGVSLSRDLIDSAAKVSSAEKGLEKRVHVAGRPLVFQSYVTSFLF